MQGPASAQMLGPESAQMQGPGSLQMQGPGSVVHRGPPPRGPPPGEFYNNYFICPVIVFLENRKKK